MLYKALEEANERPLPFEAYTARALWDDDHISARMLAFHLDESRDVASRNGPFIERSVDWIVSRFAISRNTTIADFGCGPGLYANRLAGTGAHVTGIDFSERSIRYASESAAAAGLPIRYIHQDYLAFETDDRFDLILLITCDFCALSPEQRRRLLGRFNTLLKPGGRVLLDVYSHAAFERRTEEATYERNLMDGFWSPHPYFGFLNTFKYQAEQLVLDKYTIVEADRLRTILNWFQCFTPETLAVALSDSGFRVTDLYGDVAGNPFDPESEEFAVVAELD